MSYRRFDDHGLGRLSHNHVIKNPIMDVYWAGWRSDTLTLQKNGWQISVEEDVGRHQMRIALFHPTLNLYGVMFNSVKYEYHNHGASLPILNISAVSSDIRVNISSVSFDFKPMDATPQFIPDFQPKHIRDLVLFRPVEAIQEIVVETQDVDSLLSKILEMQSPKQAELRERARKERRLNNVVDLGKYREVYNPKTDIIAQVISIGG